MIEFSLWLITLVPIFAVIFYNRLKFDHLKQKWLERIPIFLMLSLFGILFLLKKDSESILTNNDEVLIGFIYCLCFFLIKSIAPVTERIDKENIYDLIGLSGTLGIYLIDQLWTLPIFWFLHLLPSLHDLTRGQPFKWKYWRLFGLMQFLSFILLTVGVGILYYLGYGYEDLQHLNLKEHTFVVIPGVLILLAAFVRQGVFPFHVWIRDYVQYTSMQRTLHFFTSFTGFYLIYRIALPILNYDIKDIFPFISFLTIFSSLYVSAINLIENNIKSILAILIISESSLIICGFELNEKIADFGSLYQWAALMLSATGLGLLFTMVVERTGVLEIRRCYGYGEKAPLLAGFTIIMCFALIGVPGSMAFVGEDLLFHSIIEHYPLIGIGVIVATCFNALIGYRTYIYLFNGELDAFTVCPEIQKKESRVVALIVILVFFLGIVPDLVFR